MTRLDARVSSMYHFFHQLVYTTQRIRKANENLRDKVTGYDSLPKARFRLKLDSEAHNDGCRQHRSLYFRVNIIS